MAFVITARRLSGRARNTNKGIDDRQTPVGEPQIHNCQHATPNDYYIRLHS